MLDVFIESHFHVTIAVFRQQFGFVVAIFEMVFSQVNCHYVCALHGTSEKSNLRPIHLQHQSLAPSQRVQAWYEVAALLTSKLTRLVLLPLGGEGGRRPDEGGAGLRLCPDGS